MKPAASEPSGSSLAETAEMLRSSLSAHSGKWVDDPRYDRLRKALDQLFATATAAVVANLDEDAIVALVQADIIFPIRYHSKDRLDGPREYRFVLNFANELRRYIIFRSQKESGLPKEYGVVSRSLMTRSRNVAQALDAKSAARRLEDLKEEPPPPASSITEAPESSENPSIRRSWRRALDYALIGRQKIRNQAVEQDRMEDGVESATRHIDTILNLLGPPPEGSTTVHGSSPLLPTGVS